MTTNRLAALSLLILSLTGLGAWAGHYGVLAWAIGAAICILTFIICITSKEGTPAFRFTLIVSIGSFIYLCIGAGMHFLNLREFF